MHCEYCKVILIEKEKIREKEMVMGWLFIPIDII